VKPDQTVAPEIAVPVVAPRTIRSKLLLLLSRETSSGNFVPEIDGLRFLAISAVVMFHVWGNFKFYGTDAFPFPGSSHLLNRIFTQGDLGVQLFFILSGFILGLPFARWRLEGGKGVSLAVYFKRRVTRMEPPYILNLLILYLTAIVVRHQFTPGQLFPNLMASLCYCHNAIFNGPSVVNYVAWSLEIEIQFYILAPFLSMLFLIQPARLRRGFLVTCIIVMSVASEFFFAHGWLRLSILNFMQYFLIGFLMADFYLGGWNRKPARHLGFDIVCLVACVLFFSSRMLFPHGGTVVPWFGLLVVIGAFRGVLCNRIFTNRLIYTIGGMCYTIYLYHFAVVGLCGHGRLFLFRSFWPNLAVSVLIVPLVILLVSCVLFVLFEKPFMRRDWHVQLSNAALRRFGLSSAS
jgi:peptidoglycan/LPS O-acetylase OafA/YrhL